MKFDRVDIIRSRQGAFNARAGSLLALWQSSHFDMTLSKLIDKGQITEYYVITVINRTNWNKPIPALVVNNKDVGLMICLELVNAFKKAKGHTKVDAALGILARKYGWEGGTPSVSIMAEGAPSVSYVLRTKEPEAE